MAPALKPRPVINHKGKEHESVHLNHFAVHQKLTQHCKSTVLQLKKNKKPRPDFKVCLSALLMVWFSQIRQKGIPINFTRQKTYRFMWKNMLKLQLNVLKNTNNNNNNTFYSGTFPSISTSQTVFAPSCTCHAVSMIMNRWPVFFHLHSQLLFSPHHEIILKQVPDIMSSHL